MPRLILAVLVILTIAACVSAPDFPDEPVITFESLSKSEIPQTTINPLDSLMIQLSFTDGDGDLSGDSVDIFVVDSRFPGRPQPFNLPAIPAEGTANGISGDIFLNLIFEGAANPLCCIFNGRACQVDEDFPADTVVYSIQIMDRAGNLSNVVETPPVTIRCVR